jgi:hypothetical protein
LAELNDEQRLIAQLMHIEHKLQCLDRAIPAGMLGVFDDAVENEVLQYAIFVVVQELFQEYLRPDASQPPSLTDAQLSALQQEAEKKRRQLAEQFVSGGQQPPRSVSEETI